jgi:nucleoside-diphosphate-sugar epimerase
LRVAVTGASGTIGSYVLATLLDRGHELVAVGRTSPRRDDVRFSAASLGDQESLERGFAGADAVVHLAAVTSPFRAAALELLEINVSGTFRVLEAAARAGAGKVVFASSGAATGFSFPSRDRAPRYVPLDEEHPCDPDDTYGLSKLLGEQACRRWSRAHDLSTIALRINSTWYVDRVGAERALGCGWAKDLTVDDLWGRYQFQLESPDRERSTILGPPPLPRDLLWAFTDGRDAAEAFRLAVENQTIRHDVFFINGFDTCSWVETHALVAGHLPGVPVKRLLNGYATLWSYDKAATVLGYEPKHSWRDSDFAEWLGAAPSARTARRTS